MKFFLVLSGKKIKQVLIILIASFFTAGILYVENMQVSVFSTKEGPRAIYKSEANTNKVALTFNVEWGDEKAKPILEVLKKKGINNATFFLSASWAERHPDIVKQMVEDGHEIGSLGYQFKDYTNMDEKKIRRDLSLAKESFDKLGIKKITMLRPPKGNFNETVLKIVESYGYSLIHWSINAKDDTNPGVQNIVNNVLNEVKGGDIILLHASDSAQQTEKALPLILKGLKDKGLTNVTVSELLSNSDVENKEVK